VYSAPWIDGSVKSGAVLVTEPGVLTSGGFVGSGIATGGDVVAVSRSFQAPAM